MDTGTRSTMKIPRGAMRHAMDAQAIVIFALFSLVLIGAMALSIDAGFLIAERRQVQASADSAAMAAAKAALDSKSAAEVLATGQNYGSFNAGVATGNVTVNRPPTSGAYAGNNSYIQVTVTKNVTRYFVGAIYSGDWSVSASATAGIETQGANYALLTLDKTATPGIYMNGNTTITLTGNHASAYSSTTINGNGNFDVSGSIDAKSSISGAGIAPDGVHPNLPYVPDPMAGVPAPSRPLTARTGCSGDCNLQPGHYLNQTIHCKDVCNFAPGLYYFENTSVTSQNTKSEMNGPGGVMFYFTGSSYFDSKNGEVNLHAPATTPYAGGKTGVVFWYNVCGNIDFQGNGDFYVKGIFYARCSSVTMHGNPGGDAVFGQVIVGTFSVKGTSDFRLSYNAYVDTTRPAIFLVE